MDHSGLPCSTSCHWISARGENIISDSVLPGLVSSVQNVLGKVEGPRRAPCQFKKPIKALRPRRGTCWKEWKRTDPDKGLFLKIANRKK